MRFEIHHVRCCPLCVDLTTLQQQEDDASPVFWEWFSLFCLVSFLRMFVCYLCLLLDKVYIIALSSLPSKYAQNPSSYNTLYSRGVFTADGHSFEADFFERLSTPSASSTQKEPRQESRSAANSKPAAS